MSDDWVIQGTPGPEAALHAAWDLLVQPPPQVRVVPVTETVVVLPRSRDPRREVFLENCARDQVPVVLRPSGGGAVVLTPGMVTVSAIGSLKGSRQSSQLFAVFGGLVAAGLQRLGVPRLAMRGVSDLCIGDRKLVGCSLRVLLSTVLFQASVLVNPEWASLDRYLPFPSRAPDYRGNRPHRQFLVSLAEAGFPVTPEEVATCLEASFWAGLT